MTGSTLQHCMATPACLDDVGLSILQLIKFLELKDTAILQVGPGFREHWNRRGYKLWIGVTQLPISGINFQMIMLWYIFSDDHISSYNHLIPEILLEFRFTPIPSPIPAIPSPPPTAVLLWLRFFFFIWRQKLSGFMFWAKSWSGNFKRLSTCPHWSRTPKNVSLMPKQNTLWWTNIAIENGHL